MNSKPSAHFSFIYENGGVFIGTERPKLGLHATHYLSAKMEDCGYGDCEPRFHYTFIKIGYFPPETPASEITFQHNSTQNAFKVGDYVFIFEQDEWNEFFDLTGLKK